MPDKSICIYGFWQQNDKHTDIVIAKVTFKLCMMKA